MIVVEAEAAGAAAAAVMALGFPDPFHLIYCIYQGKATTEICAVDVNSTILKPLLKHVLDVQLLKTITMHFSQLFGHFAPC